MSMLSRWSNFLKGKFDNFFVKVPCFVFDGCSLTSISFSNLITPTLSLSLFLFSWCLLSPSSYLLVNSLHVVPDNHLHLASSTLPARTFLPLILSLSHIIELHAQANLLTVATAILSTHQRTCIGNVQVDTINVQRFAQSLRMEGWWVHML